jgi:hypothetical protein
MKFHRALDMATLYNVALSHRNGCASDFDPFGTKVSANAAKSGQFSREKTTRNRFP